MNWILIDKSRTVQPEKGKYSDWKPILAFEGKNQCVYCSIHQNYFGGIRNFHVEHYRPKSKFPLLKDKIQNLYYSCPVCNTFKGDDWYEKDLTNLNEIIYPNPSITNYFDLFEVNLITFEIRGKYISSNYMVEKLALNRTQLILHRKFLILQLKFEKIINKIEEQTSYLYYLIEKTGDITLVKQLRKLNDSRKEVDKVRKELFNSSGYKSRDTKRN
jgi:hypothetical protein